MNKSRKEFIKRAHSAACSEWQTEIETEFPKLFPKTKLEIGKWYKLENDNKFMFCFNGSFGNYTHYGFNSSGDWMPENRLGVHERDKYIPATDKEVKDALTTEAKIIGLKKGVKYHSFFFGTNTIGDSTLTNGWIDEENRFVMHGNCIFQKGKWATIVETITKSEAEKELGKTIVD